MTELIKFSTNENRRHHSTRAPVPAQSESVGAPPRSVLHCGGVYFGIDADVIDPDELSQFLSERNAALISLDEDYVTKMVPGAAPEMRLMILHKSRYECTAIPDKLRNESRAWLAERGFKRMTGTPLLPEGELPE